jgi:phage shock protein C
MDHVQASPKQHRDNLFGVCAALGDATGVNPIVFRLGIVAAILAGAIAPTLVAYCLAAVAIKVAQR